MVSLAQAALRGWTFLWSLLTLALVSNVIAEAFSGNPAAINYGEVAAVLCFLIVLLGLAALFIEIPPMIMSGLDVVAALASFVAGVVFAAKLGVHSCDNDSYVRSNYMTNGSHNPSKRCTELQASTAFFWFMFAGFVGSAVIGLTGGGSGISRRSLGGRKGPSNMSQV